VIKINVLRLNSEFELAQTIQLGGPTEIGDKIRLFSDRVSSCSRQKIVSGQNNG